MREPGFSRRDKPPLANSARRGDLNAFKSMVKCERCGRTPTRPRHYVKLKSQSTRRGDDTKSEKRVEHLCARCTDRQNQNGLTMAGGVSGSQRWSEMRPLTNDKIEGFESLLKWV